MSLPCLAACWDTRRAVLRRRSSCSDESEAMLTPSQASTTGDSEADTTSAMGVAAVWDYVQVTVHREATGSATPAETSTFAGIAGPCYQPIASAPTPIRSPEKFTSDGGLSLQ
jgi:hypothetical protein